MSWCVVFAFLYSAGPLPAEVAEACRRAPQSFVLLRFYFRRDPNAVADHRRLAHERLADRLYQQAVSFRWSGVVAGKNGEVLCADPCLPLERLGRVVGQFADGSTRELTLEALFENYHALLFRLKDPCKEEGTVPCLSFSEPRFSLGDPFWRLEVVFVGPDPCLQVVGEQIELLPMGRNRAWRSLFGLPTEKTPFHGSLLVDRRGRFVGYQVDYDLWDGPGGLTTYHPKAWQDRGKVPYDVYRQVCRRLAEKVRSYVVRVRIFFRNVKDEEESPRYGPVLSEEEQEETRTVYGFRIKRNRLFVPIHLDRSAIRKISRIAVGHGAGEVSGTFVGAFRKWGALIVQGGQGQAVLRVSPQAEPVRGKLFLVHRVVERFGGMYQETDYNRYFTTTIGPGDGELIKPVKEIREPAFLFDLSGNCIGVYLTRRHLVQTGRETSYQQVVSMKEFASVLQSPERYFDPLAKIAPAQRRERPVWLGVEFQPVTPKLMELRGLLEETRDGTVGLLVCHVYRNSPADRLGLRPGDVLLSVKEAGKDRPVDLLTEDRWHRRFYWSGSWRGTAEAGLPRLWRPRRNYLTSLLSKIGPGRSVVLKYLHEGKRCRAEVLLEESPEDFDSTDRRKLPLVGITVRNLTYEVRETLRLPEDFSAVVVSSVEPGGKAAIRRVRCYELITHLNDTPVGDVGCFEELLQHAVRRGDRQVLLKLWAVGEQRVVTVELKQ